MSTFGHDRNGSGGDKDKSDTVKMEMLLNTYSDGIQAHAVGIQPS